MTEQLHNYRDLEYTNKVDKLEEEADKLNELTFNSEIPWEYDEVDIDNDNCFKSFELENSILGENTVTKDSKTDCQVGKSSDDLLGLTGSLINFGIFKSNTNRESDGNNIFKDDEFETAFNKLNFVNKSPIVIDEKDIQHNPLVNEQTEEMVETSSSYTNISMESPIIQLTKFSEQLHQQFQQYQKSDASIHILNQIVSTHLNQLNKKLQLLNLSIDVLPQLRYFCILMSFVAIDSKLTEIQTKYANCPVQLNLEITKIIQHFTQQSQSQQLELCMTHPFYSNLMTMLATQNASMAIQANISSQKSYMNHQIIQNRLESRESSFPEWASDEDRKIHSDYQSRCRNFDLNEGGWMSESERDWLIKIQTRNLTTNNPYCHDYYYTQMKLKEMTEARRQQILKTGHTTLSDPLSLLPSPITGEQLGAGIDPNKDGLNPGLKPIHFEKSLGVLSPSNLNTPRQIIQVGPPVRNNQPVVNRIDKSQKLVRNHRELLGLIEKMYSIVLRIDEVDKSLARMLVEQHKSRGVLVQHRNYLLKLLMDCMTNNSKFVDLLSVSKGARIVVSTIAIVSSQQFIQIVRTLFFNSISVWESEYFREIEAELRSLICSRVRNLKSEELSTLTSTFYCNLTPNSLLSDINSGRFQPLAGFCSSEFGLYIILTLLDSLLKSNPDDKAHVTQLLSITIKSTDSQSFLQAYMKDFKILFPSSERR